MHARQDTKAIHFTSKTPEHALSPQERHVRDGERA